MLKYIETHNVKEKDIIKTIVLDDGKGIIDCVDFYKQPTVRGLNKQNFKIPTPPKFTPKNTTSNTKEENELLTEILFGNSCLNGTVGIKRTTIEELSQYTTVTRNSGIVKKQFM